MKRPVFLPRYVEEGHDDKADGVSPFSLSVWSDCEPMDLALRFWGYRSEPDKSFPAQLVQFCTSMKSEESCSFLLSDRKRSGCGRQSNIHFSATCISDYGLFFTTLGKVT